MSISKYEVLRQDDSFGVFECIYESGHLIHVSESPICPMGNDFFELAKDVDLFLKAVQKASLAAEVRNYDVVIGSLSVPD